MWENQRNGVRYLISVCMCIYLSRCIYVQVFSKQKQSSNPEFKTEWSYHTPDRQQRPGSRRSQGRSLGTFLLVCGHQNDSGSRSPYFLYLSALNTCSLFLKRVLLILMTYDIKKSMNIISYNQFTCLTLKIISISGTLMLCILPQVLSY